MASLGKIVRRTFLVGVAAIAGGVAFGVYKYREPYPNPLADGLNPYVKIDATGKITVIAPRAEMGQGISTTLAALVAEELEVPLAMVTVEHGPAGHVYFNEYVTKEGAPYPQFDDGLKASAFRSAMGVVGKFLGMQVTGGSTSTMDGFDKMRVAGAAARSMLVQAAAAKLGVSAATLETKDGKITDPASGKSLAYADVAMDAAKLQPPGDLKLKDPAQWKILGKPQKRVDMLAKVTGAPIFGIDVTQPDMVFATVRMNPKLLGPMKSFNAEVAKQVKGVLDVIEIKAQTGHGFAVVASNTWSAFKGADAVKAEWGDAPYPASSDAISAVLMQALDQGEATAMREIGDVSAVQDGELIEAGYAAPFLAHATMEPMNATARFKDGILDIWCGNQAPTVIRAVCAGVAGIEEKNCNVHTTMMGGGFGRRGEVDFPIYATLVALKTGGKPVKVTWTREEDMTHDVYRPAAVARLSARVANGKPLSFAAKIASPSILRSLLMRTFPSISPMGPDKAIVDGGFNQPYAFPNLKVEGVEAPLDMPLGFWRSVGYSYNCFFHESFVDEIALAAKQDPVALRLALMEPYAPAVGVVKKVAEMADWTAPKQDGRGKGIAFSLAFGSWAAMAIEVSGTADKIKIENVWAAVDAGRILDPAIFESQIVSAAIYGLSAATGLEITFKDGMVEQQSFPGYAPMRMPQAPKFTVALLETAPEIGGAGEIGTPPAAPALANAIFALTGKRIRTLPLSKEVGFA